MNTFPCRSNAVGDIGLFSNRKIHSHVDDKEEATIDPMEEEGENIKPEGAKGPAENNPNRE